MSDDQRINRVELERCLELALQRRDELERRADGAAVDATVDSYTEQEFVRVAHELGLSEAEARHGWEQAMVERRIADDNRAFGVAAKRAVAATAIGLAGAGVLWLVGRLVFG
jgi:hypothetical protein